MLDSWPKALGLLTHFYQLAHGRVELFQFAFLAQRFMDYIGRIGDLSKPKDSGGPFEPMDQVRQQLVFWMAVQCVGNSLTNASTRTGSRTFGATRPIGAFFPVSIWSAGLDDRSK